MKTPKYFINCKKQFTLTADVMFVNDISFLVIFSQNIILITCKYVLTTTAGQLAKYLLKIVKLYVRDGYVTCLVIMDMEFEKVKDKVGLLEINTTSAREYVANIERQIRLMWY